MVQLAGSCPGLFLEFCCIFFSAIVVELRNKYHDLFRPLPISVLAIEKVIDCMRATRPWGTRRVTMAIQLPRRVARVAESMDMDSNEEVARLEFKEAGVTNSTSSELVPTIHHHCHCHCRRKSANSTSKPPSRPHHTEHMRTRVHSPSPTPPRTASDRISRPWGRPIASRPALLCPSTTRHPRANRYHC